MGNVSTNVLVEDLSALPVEVQELLTRREVARKLKDFAASDSLRDQIKSLGYLVNDKPYGTKILKMGDEELIPAKHFLLLFGSGEIAPSSVDIYRQTFLALNKRHLKISLITTPAGFQPNVSHVYGEIKDFLIASLPDFNLSVEIIFANRLEDANNPAIVEALEGSDVIFMGPGSPSYAGKHLMGSVLFKKIIDRVKNGSTLILASAATIACSKNLLPVYEIFKVGNDLHWLPGLDLYSAIWKDLTVIPHFNNREGGVDLDTTYCYIGKTRATKLLAQLIDATPVIGLDEHTCLTIDLDTGAESIRGKGSVHEIKI